MRNTCIQRRPKMKLYYDSYNLEFLDTWPHRMIKVFWREESFKAVYFVLELLEHVKYMQLNSNFRKYVKFI